MDKFIDLLLGFLHIFKFFEVVEPGRRAICVFLGKWWVRDWGPGFHFMVPLYMDRVYEEDVVEQTDTYEEVTGTTLDGKELTFVPAIRREIHSVWKTVFNVDDWETSLTAHVSAALYMLITTNEAATLTAEFLGREIKEAVKYRAFKWGITIREVLITDSPRVETHRLLGSIMG